MQRYARTISIITSLLFFITSNNLEASKSKNKSGIAPQVLTLPKGGGSVNGLGESFVPDLNSGTGSYTIPLTLPEGRNGFGPSLELSYSSGRGNGPFGLGWSVGIPKISRRTEKGVPLYNDDEDIFTFNGMELFKVSKNKFRPRREGFFGKIFHKKDSAKDYWEVWTKEGEKFYFGDKDTSRIESNQQIFSWFLTRMIDANGNEIIYKYISDCTNNVYLSHIDYAIYSIDFMYELRSDKYTHYRSGLKIGNSLRCKEILIQLNIPAEKRTDRIRKYVLNYAESPGSGISLLSKVTQFGTDDTAFLPPLELSYSQFDANGTYSQMNSDRGAPPQSLSDPNYELTDVNADGLADVLYTSPTGHYYWLNYGENNWSPTQKIHRSPQNAQLSDDGVILADMDGNGKSDLLFSQGTSFGYWRNYGNQEREEFISYRRMPGFSFKDPNVRMMDVDGDGLTDVIQTTNRYFTYWLNLDGKAWDRPVSRRFSSIFKENDGPGTFFSTDPESDARLADMNGDGLQDIVSVHNGNIRYWPHRGFLRFGDMVRMSGTPRLPFNRFKRNRFLTGDINNDGFADLIYVDVTRVYYWFNLHGESWSKQYELKSTPYAQGDADVRLGDMNGNGTRDLIWSTPVRSSDRTNYRYFDFVGTDQYPNLLIKINNNMGLITYITYKPVIQDYLQAKKSGKPWTRKLPIAVKTVAQITLSDNISKNEVITSYKYSDGYFDGRDREFSGFGYAESRSIGDKSSQDALIKEFYEVGYGEFMDPWHAEQQRSQRGTLLRREIYGLDGASQENKPYQITTNFWNSVSIDTIKQKDYQGRTRFRYVFFPYLSGSLTSSYERTDHPRHSAVKYDYDIKYGTQTKTIGYGEVNAWDINQSEPNDNSADGQKITELKYAVRDDAVGFIVVPWKTKITDDRGVLLGESENFYDGESFKGLPSGQVTKGLLHRVRQRVYTPEIWNRVYGDVDWSQFKDIPQNEWLDVAKYEYGSWGLLKSYRDAKNIKVLSVEYDNYKMFPEKIINSLGHTQQAKYDYIFSQIIQFIDNNNSVIDYFYDKLGLVERVIRPGDSKDYPTIWYAYCLNIYKEQLDAGNANPSPPYITTWMREHPPQSGEEEKNHSLPNNPKDEEDTYLTRLFFDGFGRNVQTRSEAPDDMVLVSGWTKYNAKGNPKIKYLPFFSNGFDYITEEKSQDPIDRNIEISLFYDPLEHLIEINNPNGTYSKTKYLPWQTIMYDEEDVNNIGAHYDTPRITYLDGFQRLVKVVEFASTAKDSIITQYQYDLNDNLVTIIDATGKDANKRHMIYDLLGRKLRAFEPNTGTRIYFYDENGNLIYQRDNKKQWIRYEYDELNRLIKKYNWGFSNKPVVKNTYDSGDGENLIGRLAHVKDESGVLKYSYDQRGRIEWKEKQLDGLKGVYKTSYRYDSMDRVTQIYYPGSNPFAVIYKYNNGNQLNSIPGYMKEITYNAKGQRTSIRYGNNVQTDYSYDSQTFLLDTLKTTSNGGTTGDLQYFTYNYDNVGNILNIDDKTSQSANQTYTYDALYQLAHAVRTGHLSYDVSYAYDKIGNMVQKSNLASGIFKYDVDGRPHTLDSYGNITLRYDDNGNLIETPNMKLYWDYECRLQKVEKIDGTIVEYVYDTNGIRTMKSVKKGNESSLEYYFDKTFEIRNDKEKYYLFNDDERICSTSAKGAIDYYHSDHLGSIAFISNLGGKCDKNKILYLPFGEESNNSNNSILYKYTGKEFDNETALYYFGARYYSPFWGKWISSDPLYRDYPEKRLNNLSGFNLYAYANNNPVIHIDPDGYEVIIYGVSGSDFVEKTKEAFKKLAGSSVSFEKLDVVRTKVTIKGGLLADYPQYNKGRQLVLALSVSKKRLIEIYGKEGKGSSTYTAPNRASGGRAVISLQIKHPENILVWKNRKELTTMQEKTQPYISLGHELIHAYHELKGKFGTGRPVNVKYKNPERKLQTEFVEGEEASTIGIKGSQKSNFTENELRQEAIKRGEDIHLRVSHQ